MTETRLDPLEDKDLREIDSGYEDNAKSSFQL